MDVGQAVEKDFSKAAATGTLLAYSEVGLSAGLKEIDWVERWDGSQVDWLAAWKDARQAAWKDARQVVWKDSRQAELKAERRAALRFVWKAAWKALRKAFRKAAWRVVWKEACTAVWRVVWKDSQESAKKAEWKVVWKAARQAEWKVVQKAVRKAVWQAARKAVWKVARKAVQKAETKVAALDDLLIEYSAHWSDVQMADSMDLSLVLKRQERTKVEWQVALLVLNWVVWLVGMSEIVTVKQTVVSLEFSKTVDSKVVQQV